MSRSELCRLCVNLCKDLKSLYDENGHGNELYEITRKYFHPMILDMEQWKNLSGMCGQCWRHICDFHDFQASILVAQLKLIEGGGGIKQELQELEDSVGASTSRVSSETLDVKLEEEFISLTEAEKLNLNGDRLCISEMVQINDGRSLTRPVVNSGAVSSKDCKILKLRGNPGQEALNNAELPKKSPRLTSNKVNASKTPLAKDYKSWSELELSESETDDLSSDDEWVLAKCASKSKRKQIQDKITAELILKDQVSQAADGQLSSELELTDSEADVDLSLNSSDASTGSTEKLEDYAKIRRQKLNDLVAKWMPNIKCSLCPEICGSFSLLQKHFRQMHPKEKFSITCCNRKLYAPTRIREHLLLHDNPDTFRCKLCGRYYTTAATLNGHMALHHPESLEPKRYTCRKCGKSFEAQKRLKHHKKVSHATRAAHRRTRRRRAAIVPADGPNAFSCSGCGKFFDKYRSFTQHTWYCHKLGPRHKCAVCDKSFKLKCDLRKHVALHTGYLLCTFCPKTFLDISSLHEHRKADHPLETGGTLENK